MSNTIKLKRGSGSDPGASDLVVGEVAVRTDTGKLFTKKDDNSIAEISGGISDGDKGDITVSSSGATFTIDSGVVTSAKIADDTIVNADINSSAAIALSKLATGTLPSGITIARANLQNNIVKNGEVASDAAIAGSKIDPDFGSQNIVTTGTLGSDDITITGGQPALSFIDDGANPDYKLYNNNGTLRLYDITNTADRLVVNTDGHVDITGNLDVGAGIDVTGTVTASDGFVSEGGVVFTGANYNANWVKASNLLRFQDNAKATFGASDDLQIYHTSTQNYLSTSNGNIELRHTVGGADEALLKAIPDGAVELFHNGTKKFETTTNGVEVTGDLRFDVSVSGGTIRLGDDQKLFLGGGDDLKIYHDGSNSYLAESGTGDLIISSSVIRPRTDQFTLNNAANTENMIQAVADGAVSLFHNGSTKFATTSSGGTVTGTLVADAFTGPLTGNVTGNASGSSGSCTGNAATATALANARTIAGVSFDGSANISLNNNAITNGAGYIATVADTTIAPSTIDMEDNEKIKLGTGDDLEIYHNGSHSFVENSTGNLHLRAKAGENSIAAVPDGGVELYHDNSKKAETVSGGFTVTGTCTATAFAGDGSSLTGISAGATGGGSDEVFYENSQTVTTNYTITNGKNAMSAGPITINSGVTVTVGSGETLTIV